MSRAGLLVAGIIVCVIAGVGAYFLFREEGPPVYPGATPAAVPAKYSAFEELGASAYTVTDTAEEVVSWYKSQAPAAGWDNLVTDTSIDNDRMLVYSKGDELLVIIVCDGTLILVQGTIAEFQQVLAEYVSELYVPPVSMLCTADVSGFIMDKNYTTPDEFTNGKVIIDVVIKTDDIDDVLDPRNPMIITISGRGKLWSTGALNLKTLSGKTEADYGQTITIEGILDPATTGIDNLWYKISVPTTSGGEVDEGMSIGIELAPVCWEDTTGMDHGGTAAIDPGAGEKILISATNLTGLSNFSGWNLENTTADWWDERDIIDIKINARADALTLTGLDGAYLLGSTMDRY